MFVCLFVCLRVVTCGWEVELELELELELGVSKKKGLFLFWVRWERKCEVNVLCYRPVCVC